MHFIYKAAEVKGTEAELGAAWEKAQLSPPLPPLCLHSGSSLKQFTGLRAQGVLLLL